MLNSVIRRFLLVVLLSTYGFLSRGFADDRAVEQRTSVIHLTNGDHASGTLVHSPMGDCLGWQSPAFASPFQFNLGGVASIHFSTPAVLPPPQGTYSFEMAGGDLLFGSLNGLDADVAILDIPGVGRLTVDRAVIQRMSRRDGGSEQLYVGPSGLNGWTTSGDPNVWREDAGHLIADKPGAVLRRNFGIPNQARIEFELSWSNHPDFDLAIGVGDDPKTVARAFRFEVWENEIVVQRETEREADVVRLQSVTGKTGRLHVQAFLDQALGRMLVFSSSGAPLADLTVATSKANVQGGLQITNRAGDIRLERLQIGRWNGEPPSNVEIDKSRIHAGDGTVTYGVLKSFDPDKREFLIGDDAKFQRIPENAVHDVYLSQPGELTPRSLKAVYLTGMKISGELIRVEDQQALMKCPGIQELVAVPLNVMQSLIVLKPKSDSPELPQRRGRFETNGTTLHGCLVDGSEGDASCLIWQPARSMTSSAIQHGISAKIVYRDPPAPVQVNPAQQHQIRQMAIPKRVARSTTSSGVKKGGIVLHLRTGDMIPCEAASIDEKEGVTFKSKFSEGTFVPNHQIKALELISDAVPVEIGKSKKERLLTLPRMQRDNPPTHLIRGVDGDYLRGRLISMDDTQIHVELRLEGKIVRRDRIARIIWLHPESLDPSTKEKGPTDSNPNLVQALLSDGNRLTFLPEQVDGSTLSGRSELLGACPVDLQHVDQLLIGAVIELATAELAFHQWKLKSAADPMVPKEGADGSGDGGEGQESALIGKAAPAIRLKTLDGKEFDLSNYKDKVVVLDFWASWCGPCLQVMPQIDKVTHEFADQGVELFAVNLEETPEKIKAALERLSLSTTVLLDRDGRIAEKYGATSIPQTVIINRDGTVARLFVGGGARFDEQLRGALKTVLSGAIPKTE